MCIRLHQEVVEESFLPTVRTLMNAPATSPLAEVDINNVVELLVELTRPSGLIKPSSNTEVRSSLWDKCVIVISHLIAALSFSCYCFIHKCIIILPQQTTQMKSAKLSHKSFNV